MGEISLVATLTATVAGFALGALWYGPLFGKSWMRAVGMTPEEIRRDFSPARTYGATFVLGLVAAYAFGLYLGPNPGRAFAIVAGGAAGVCWVATSLAMNYLFERKPAVLIAINGGYHAVRFTLIGLAFGLLG
ncbi:MAG TPA: DUF1761 domain-containing protein [Vicinamibacterales bacterium]